MPRTGKVNVVAAQRRRLKCITARRNGKTARFGREHFPAENFRRSASGPKHLSVNNVCFRLGADGITMSTAIPQNQFKTEIDMARSAARQHQLGGGAADSVAMNADGAEAWRDQPAHFKIAEADDRDRLVRRRAIL